MLTPPPKPYRVPLTTSWFPASMACTKRGINLLAEISVCTNTSILRTLGIGMCTWVRLVVAITIIVRCVVNVIVLVLVVILVFSSTTTGIYSYYYPNYYSLYDYHLLMLVKHKRLTSRSRGHIHVGDQPHPWREERNHSVYGEHWSISPLL